MFRRRGDDQESSADSADQAAQAASKIALTQEELDRRIQAETDRREAKRAAQAQAERKRKLRDEDPWAYAEEDRKAEEIAQGSGAFQQFLGNLGAEHDRVSIDPVIELLPKQEQERIMRLEGAGRGLEGRKLVVKEAMKALEKHWKAEGARDAEQKLRRNPAFRKQVLSEGRGQITDQDLLPAASRAEADKKMSDILRSHYRLG